MLSMWSNVFSASNAAYIASHSLSKPRRTRGERFEVDDGEAGVVAEEFLERIELVFLVGDPAKPGATDLLGNECRFGFSEALKLNRLAGDFLDERLLIEAIGIEGIGPGMGLGLDGFGALGRQNELYSRESVLQRVLA